MAGRSHFEHRARRRFAYVRAGVSYPVEIAVAALRQTACRGCVRVEIDREQPRQAAVGGDSEYRSITVRSTRNGCAVEVAIFAFRQTCIWIIAVGRIEGRHSAQTSVGRELKEN